MVVAAASPPSEPRSTSRAHPTYKEMIVQALTDLRDPSGSSRRAIASYIADHFSGLHSSHDALLSVHLRRLMSQGQLHVVSGNYFLFPAGAAPPPQQRRGRGRPPKPKPKPAPGAKRGRGRPRKNPDLAAPSAPMPIFLGPKRGSGRPRKDASVQAHVPVASSASPLQAAIAPPPPSADKRGRGRPRKNSLDLVAWSSSPLLGAIAPPFPSGLKRGRGRPRKNSLVLVSSSSSRLLGGIAPPSQSGVKRGRGRPRKNDIPVVPSSSPLPLAIVPPPPSEVVKRGRGRPRKNSHPVASPLLGVNQGPRPQRNTTIVSLLSVAMPRSNSVFGASSDSVFGAKRGRGRPPKVVLAGKRKRGRPPKEKTQPESVRSMDAPLTKREPGSPRKEETLESRHLIAAKLTVCGHEALPTRAADHARAVQDEVEAGRQTFDSSKEVSVSSNSVFGAKRGRGRPPKKKVQPETAQSLDAPSTERDPGRPRKEETSENELLKAAQMTEGGHEALSTQTTDQAGAVQNEVEPRSLQSFGTPLTEKRGRGRPRKRPLETEPSETGVAALVEKRGRGRPRKQNPSAGTSASTGIKRGRGRPRKAKPFETAVVVSTDLTEGRSEKDGDLGSGKKAQTQGVLLVEGMDDGPAVTGHMLVSREEVAAAPVDAGSAMLRVDPVYFNVAKSH